MLQFCISWSKFYSQSTIIVNRFIFVFVTVQHTAKMYTKNTKWKIYFYILCSKLDRLIYNKNNQYI